MSHKPNSPRLGRGCIVASLCTATVLWVAAAELDAAPINFTSSSRFAQAPTSDGAAGSLVVAGIPGTPGPSLLDGPNGFSYTDVQLTYTAPLADVGNLIRITWRILRDFTEPAAAFTNTSILSGVVTLEVD